MTELVTVTESQLSYVRCDTRYSNPAPSITWTLGDQIIASNSYNQTNAPEKNIAQKVKQDYGLNILTYILYTPDPQYFMASLQIQ